MNATSDFADWLSPMLVKELRQGMRSRLFVISFLVLQAAMIFLAIIGLSASAKQQDTSAITGFFWTIIGVPLILIMPMSGLNAVGNERKANTLELIFLTRLTPRRIIAGKWFAIVAQTVLLICAILPYAVLRYFLGGVNLGTELTIIATLLFGSALLSGMAVGLSPQSSRLTRSLLVVGIFVALQALPRLFFGFRIMGGPTSSWGMDWKTYACLGWLGVLVLLFMIEFGASKIAPLAENHSTSRRLLGLFALTVVAIFGGRSFSDSPLWVCSVVFLVVICVGALSEPLRLVPSIYRPFTKFGVWGRIAGRLLYPGWPSGVFFSILALTVMATVGFWQGRAAIEEKWILWAAVTTAGALFLPAAIIRTFLPRSARPFFIYIGIQVILALLVALSASLQAFGASDLRPFIAAIPTCGLLLVGTSALNDENFFAVFVGTSLITAASIVLLLVKMRKPWGEIRMLEKAAVGLPSGSTSNAAERPTTA